MGSWLSTVHTTRGRLALFFLHSQYPVGQETSYKTPFNTVELDVSIDLVLSKYDLLPDSSGMS